MGSSEVARSFRTSCSQTAETAQHDSPSALPQVACGAQSGGIDLFQWGSFKDRVERISGCPASVDALVAYDSDTLIAGLTAVHCLQHTSFTGCSA